MDALDELIDVRAPPVVTIGKTSPKPKFLPGRAVGKFQFAARRVLFRVGIKIIIELHAIHVVALHHVHDHAQNVGPHGRFAGVEPGLFAVFANQFRVRS